MSRGILAFIGGLGQGVISGLKDQDERERRDKADQRAQESHDAQMSEFRRGESDRRTIAGAAADVGVEEGSGGALKPDTADNRDVGMPGEPGAATGGLGAGFRVAGKGFGDRASADAAAATANAPEARDARISQAYRSIGQPDKALSMENASLQQKKTKFDLSKDQEAYINEKADQVALTVNTPEALKSFLSGSPVVGGKEVTIATTPDGKKFQMMIPGTDGNMVKFGPELSTDPKEIQKAVAMQFTHMKVHEKIGILQHDEQYRTQQAQFEETKKLQREQMAMQQRHNMAIEGNAAAGLKLQRDKFDADLKNDPTHNLPGAVKMTVASLDKSINSIEKSMADANAKGELNPEGGKQLQAQLANLNNRRAELLKPYLGEAGATKPYPFGGPAATKSTTGIDKAPPGSVVKQGGSWTAAPAQGAAAGGLPASMAAQPAARAASSDGRDPLLAALGANTGNAAIDQIVAQKAPALRDAKTALDQANQVIVQTAKGGDQAAVAQASQAAMQARAVIDNMLKDMAPAQAKQVVEALGL